MRLRLDGHRLTPAETLDLLNEAGLRALSDRNAADGYRLNPVRAPRRMENGGVTFKVSWTQRAKNLRATLRLRVVLDATPV
jgi:hypothetical protein